MEGEEGERERMIPPRERLQMQRIREVDLEQLEVEEVDSDSSDSQEEDYSRFETRGQSGDNEFTFDTSLACLHSYLGEVDDITCRRTLLEDGAHLTLPMFYLEGSVLFPEATLPLRVIQPRFKAALELAMQHEDAPYTIGVIHVPARSQDNGFHFSLVGTTAEIRRLRRFEDGSINVVTRGRQCFRICHPFANADGAPLAQVQIIPEDIPLHIPRDAFGLLASFPHMESGRIPRDSKASDTPEREDLEQDTGPDDEEHLLATILNRHVGDSSGNSLQSTGRQSDEISSEDEARHRWWWHRRANRRVSTGFLRNDGTNQSEMGTREDILPNSEDLETKGDFDSMGKRRRIGGWGGACKAWAADEAKWLHRAQRTAWPHWVYRMFDAYDLARRAADMWRQLVELPSIDDMVNKPVLLSYHIASKIPVQDATRQELLEINEVVYRLRREIQLLESIDRLRCKNCLKVIAKRSDMLAMSADGPIDAYVNKYGYVHETLTLRRAHGLILQGRPETQHSWFPGYSWTIADCSNCGSHMGWLFSAVKNNISPHSFWGVRRSQLADNMS